MNKWILAVSYYSNYNCKETPFIRLQGKWLEDAGFKIGDKVEVRDQRGELVIKDKISTYRSRCLSFITNSSDKVLASPIS